MKRTVHVATIQDPEGRTVATAETYAWNSGIKKSEVLMGGIAREHGRHAEGWSPVRVMADQGYEEVDVYRRKWFIPGVGVYEAEVRPLAPLVHDK